MSNIKHKPIIKKGKEKLISWVRRNKLIVTPNTFTKIFDIPRIENPDFDFPNVGMPDLPTISRKMLLVDHTWDGEVECNKTHLNISTSFYSFFLVILYCLLSALLL